MLDSFWLRADTPHHMRPADTMIPKDQGESIPSFNRTPTGGAARPAGLPVNLNVRRA